MAVIINVSEADAVQPYEEEDACHMRRRIHAKYHGSNYQRE
jgi:hypothetical protein